MKTIGTEKTIHDIINTGKDKLKTRKVTLKRDEKLQAIHALASKLEKDLEAIRDAKEVFENDKEALDEAGLLRIESVVYLVADYSLTDIASIKALSEKE